MKEKRRVQHCLYHMASPAQNNTSSHDWLCTQTRGDRIEFEWTIKKFHQLSAENGERILPPVFPNNRIEQWKLSIYPRGWGEENAEWISIFIYRISNEKAGLKVKGDITIYQLNKALGKMAFTHEFQNETGFGEARLVERSKLSVEDDATDAITIRCKIEVLGTYITSSLKTKFPDMAVHFGVRENRLTEDFRSFYKNLKLSDFTVISRDKAFPTHKLILASRSPVFAAIFDHKKVSENVKNEWKIDNIEPAVVEGLLEYIYTDDVSEIGELAHGLLAAAEQYGLKDLKLLCEETLYKTLNEDNATELLALADLHNATQLKKYIMQFIVENPKNVVKSEAFSTVEMPLDLAKEMIRAVILTDSENSSD